MHKLDEYANKNEYHLQMRITRNKLAWNLHPSKNRANPNNGTPLWENMVKSRRSHELTQGRGLVKGSPIAPYTRSYCVWCDLGIAATKQAVLLHKNNRNEYAPVYAHARIVPTLNANDYHSENFTKLYTSTP